MGEVQYGYFGHIAKYEKTEDGTLMVYGKAAGPDLDLDDQICDPTWLKSAMPDWSKWGNVREQHANIAAGVGVELTQDGDDWYLKAEIVDPATIRKVEKRVLKGFSVGIVNGFVRRDAKARGGRITDGTIAEISLVDRPANPTATLSIAKSAGGATLGPVEAEADEVEAFTLEHADLFEGLDLGSIDLDAPEGDDSVEDFEPAESNQPGLFELQIIDDPLPPERTAEQRAELMAKTAGWYREALRTVEDALAGQWSRAVPFITKAAPAVSVDERADVDGAQGAIDTIADLIISEAQALKGGNLRQPRDIEVLTQATRSLHGFVSEDGADELADDDVAMPGEGEAYMAKAYGSAWSIDDEITRQGLIEKRDFSEALREHLADSGDAMPNGSYPIRTQADLDNAVHLAGHSASYSEEQVRAHIRAMARKHGLTLPDSMAEGSATNKAAGDATVGADTTEIITKAVAAARAEMQRAHEADMASLRAELDKALKAPAAGGPVTYKRVSATSSAPSQSATPGAEWRAKADQPGLAPEIRRAYIAKAASLEGAST